MIPQTILLLLLMKPFGLCISPSLQRSCLYLLKRRGCGVVWHLFIGYICVDEVTFLRESARWGEALTPMLGVEAACDLGRLAGTDSQTSLRPALVPHQDLPYSGCLLLCCVVLCEYRVNTCHCQERLSGQAWIGLGGGTRVTLVRSLSQQRATVRGHREGRV